VASLSDLRKYDQDVALAAGYVANSDQARAEVDDKGRG
jgi:hypothetical protein